MTCQRIAPIVEGHGEVQAIRLLLERVWREIVHAKSHLAVLKPSRLPRTQVTRPADLERALRYARAKLQAAEGEAKSSVLLLMDSDEDPPCELAPRLLERASGVAGDLDVICVLPRIEYETWFVAAAESLSDLLELGYDDPPEDPESAGCGKRWIAKRFTGPSYSETVDQPRLTSRMDLALCRLRSASFDKLCRELEKRARELEKD